MELVTDNFVEMHMMKMDEMDKFIAGVNGLKNFEAAGAAKRIESGGEVPRGWQRIHDQIGLYKAKNPVTGEVVHGTIGEETRLTMEHIGKILKVAGFGFEDVVKCTCHLADIRDFDAFNRVYSEFFQGVLPARTTVQSGLGDGIKVEIDAVAKRS